MKSIIAKISDSYFGVDFVAVILQTLRDSDDPSDEQVTYAFAYLDAFNTVAVFSALLS